MTCTVTRTPPDPPPKIERVELRSGEYAIKLSARPAYSRERLYIRAEQHPMNTGDEFTYPIEDVRAFANALIELCDQVEGL